MSAGQASPTRGAAAREDNRGVSKSKEPLDAYRRVRKPVPPPERTLPDRRTKRAKQRARREIEEEEERNQR
jgi:hypothetical protein